MTVTDEERREVAEHLKGLADGHAAVECSAVAKALNLDYEVHGSVAAFSADAVSHVADLIDPTCEVIWSVVKNIYDGGDATWQHKFSCGHVVVTETFDCPRYCPICGARCVEEGDDDGD